VTRRRASARDGGRPLRRVLVANRGEIAVRIVRACRDLGIESIVAHSDVDADSLACRLADRTVCVGGPRPAQSYLNGQALVTAALALAADGIHPGYGFLAENADFAQLCAANDLVFVGPHASAI
jgi:acetyl-CoA carboxylase biotin carboxylase subunit